MLERTLGIYPMILAAFISIFPNITKASDRPLNIFGLKLSDTYQETAQKLQAKGFQCFEALQAQLMTCTKPSSPPSVVIEATTILFLEHMAHQAGVEERRNFEPFLPAIRAASTASLEEEFVIRHSYDGSDAITVSCAAISACEYSPDELMSNLSASNDMASTQARLTRVRMH